MMNLNSELQVTLSRLKQLDCPHLTNKEDWWIQRLLFEPGHHRSQLLEWFILKLSLDGREETHSLNSPGEKVNYLISAFSSLGLCKKTDKNLITGKAKKSVQLQFWKLLIDILWEQAGFSQISCSGSVSSEYSKTSEALRRIASSVAMKDLFMEQVSFVSPDVMEDVNTLLSSFGDDELKRLNIPSLEEFKSQVKENSSSSSEVTLSDSSPFLISSVKHSDSPSIEEKNTPQIDDLNMGLKELCSNHLKFTDMYNILKPVLKPTDNSVHDIGNEFKIQCLKLEELSQFFSDATIAQKANLHIEEMKLDSNIKSHIKLSLAGGDLQDYITTMKESLSKL